MWTEIMIHYDNAFETPHFMDYIFRVHLHRTNRRRRRTKANREMTDQTAKAATCNIIIEIAIIVYFVLNETLYENVQ